MHALARRERPGTFDDLLDAPFQHAGVARDTAREGAIFDSGIGDDRQDLIDPRSAEQHVHADLGRSPCRGDLAVAVERHDFQIRGRAALLDGHVESLQLVDRQADVLEADMADAKGERGLKLFRRVLDRAVVAREHEDETKTHHDYPFEFVWPWSARRRAAGHKQARFADWRDRQSPGLRCRTRCRGRDWCGRTGGRALCSRPLRGRDTSPGIRP